MPSQDATQLLQQDHDEVRNLFSKVRGGDASEAIVGTIIEELTIHTEIEEQELYPWVEQNVEGGADLVEEAHQEHAEAKELIAQLETLTPDDDGFMDVLTSLMEGVEHHAEEEEREMFPKIRKSSDEETRRQLGEALATAKRQLKSGSGTSGRTGSSVRGGTSTGLENLTKDELYKRAQKAGIEGRSDMTKDELIKALGTS